MGAEIKLALEAKLADLLRGVRREAIHIERCADPFDESQSLQDRELAVDCINLNSTVLAHVKSALQRVDDGSYGACLECDEAISPARLKAVPWAPLCLKCQQEAEKAA